MGNNTLESSTILDNTSVVVPTEENNVEDKDVITMLQWEIAKRLLPATISLYLILIIGIFGNIAAITFYVQSSKRTPPTALITSMAVADLGTCLAAIPVVSEMIISVTYSLAIVCKLTHFCGLWSGSSACFILWLISIDRYRKICLPLRKQMTSTTVKYLVLGVVSFALFLSVRFLMTFNSVEVNIKVKGDNTTVKGQYCTTNDDYKLISLVFYAIDFLFILMIWITVVVTYSRIIYTIVKRGTSLFQLVPSQQNIRYIANSKSLRNDGNARISKFEVRVRKGTNTPQINLSDVDLDLSVSDIKTDETEVHTITGCSEEQPKKQCNGTVSPTQKTKFPSTSKKTPSEVKLTIMMFVVSMIFILCFTPYFAVRIFIRIVMDSGNEYEFNAGLQFTLKLPYINSAFNPIIYYVFNPNFRRYISVCFCKCWLY